MRIVLILACLLVSACAASGRQASVAPVPAPDPDIVPLTLEQARQVE